MLCRWAEIVHQLKKKGKCNKKKQSNTAKQTNLFKTLSNKFSNGKYDALQGSIKELINAERKK